MQDRGKSKNYNVIKEDLLAQIVEEEENDFGDNQRFGEQPTTKVETVSFFGILVNLFFSIFILPILGGFFTVEPQVHALVVFFGSLSRVVTSPGWYYFPVIGRNIIRIPTSTQTLDIKKTTVVDKKGNPIVVAGVVTFQLVDTIRAAFDVVDYNHYLERQSLAVLKRVCSLYPYECKTGKSLQSETGEVCRTMVSLLQKKADICGARIISYELADLQYAPEIASQMLVRQQAEALVEARHTIVDGAVSIVTGAVEKLRDNGIAFRDNEQARLVSNLLAVICGDAHVQPTFSISEGAADDRANEEAEQVSKSTLELLHKIALNTSPKQH